jgi:hypothetical protein
MQAKTSIVSTAIPFGREGAQFRISVVFSPRIPPNGSMANWPDLLTTREKTVREFNVIFSNTLKDGKPVDTPALTGEFDQKSVRPDHDKWEALMSADVDRAVVTADWRPEKTSDKPVRSIPRRDIAKSLRFVYGKLLHGHADRSFRAAGAISTFLKPLSWETAAPVDRAMPPGSHAIPNMNAYMERDLHRLGIASQFRTGVPDALNRIAGDLAVYRAIRSAGEPDGPFRDKDFMQAALFHRRVPPPPNQLITATRTSTTAPDFDLNHRISLIRNYPALLRPLGLVVDILVTPPAPLPDTGFVRVEPAWGTDWVSPWTAYNAADGNFQALDDPARPWISGGALNLGLQMPSRPSTERKFVLETIDVDGAALKLVNQANAQRQSDTTDVPGWDETVPSDLPPALRTSGISLIWTDRAADVVTARDHAASLLDDSSPMLYAQDLAMGYRPEIHAANPRRPDAPGKWFPLCVRRESYELPQPYVPPPDRPDGEAGVREGFVRTSATRPNDKVEAQNEAPVEDQVPETIFHWRGRPLGIAPAVDDTQSTEQDQSERGQARSAPWGIKAKLQEVPGTLPPLRLGQVYGCRVPTMDLAGNSRDFSKLEIPDRTLEIAYLRNEPLLPPEVLLFEELNVHAAPGTNLDRLVIRDGSGFDMRWLIPPRVSQDFAEAHGVLDSGPLSEIGGFEGLHMESDGTIPLDPKSKNPIGRQNRGETVATRYYPDPLARSVCFSITDLVTGKVSEPLGTPLDFYPRSNWPKAMPLQLAIVASHPHTGRNAPPPQMEAKMQGRDLLQLALPPSWMVKVRVSSGFGLDSYSASRLSLMDLWAHYTGSSDSKNIGAVTAIDAAAGRNPMLSPFRELVLVHAVSQPVKPPVLHTVDVKRELGASDAALTIPADIHANSTSTLDVIAEWDEKVDNPSEPKPRDEHNRVPLSGLTNKELATEMLAVDVKTRQAFGDTKYRRVLYSLVANSRFSDYFPKKGVSFSKASEHPAEAIILSSARPPKPDVAYIVPTFGWSSAPAEHDPAGSFRSTRIGGGLRVYLNRPWHESGDGEKLGVVLASTGVTPDVPLRPFYTRWGEDPIRSGAAITSDYPVVKSFTDDATKATTHKLAETPEKSADILPFGVEFDEERRLWFADVVAAHVPSYGCFIRLALVRYQELSMQGVAISETVQAGYGQLWPDRSATVARVPGDGSALHVQIFGLGNPAAGDNPANTYEVVAYKTCSDLHGELGWVVDADVSVGPYPAKNRKGPTDKDLLADFIVRFPHKCGSRRILVREKEVYASATPNWRLVYADVLEI